MRVRTLGAAAAAVLAITGLTGCKTNVGTAAVIDGHRVTESDVNQYLTANAQPITQQDGKQMSPRSFVVNTLINERLGFALLRAIPSLQDVTTTQLDTQAKQTFGDETPPQLNGYSADFIRLYLRVNELIVLVRQQPQNVVDKAFSEVDFHASVSPRYGQWDNREFRFLPGARTPSYLEVQGAAPAAQGNS